MPQKSLIDLDYKKMGSVDGMGWCILASDLVIVVEWLVLLCR